MYSIFYLGKLCLVGHLCVGEGVTKKRCEEKGSFWTFLRRSVALSKNISWFLAWLEVWDLWAYRMRKIFQPRLDLLVLVVKRDV